MNTARPRYRNALVWFRRDLRFVDNAALFHALANARQVWCVFVFDRDILQALPSRRNRRVEFIWHSLVQLDAVLREHGGGLMVKHGRAEEEIPALTLALQIDAVFANRDYEPAAMARDARVAASLRAQGRTFEDFKDQVIFDRDEILTGSGGIYSVFTPYKNNWLKKVEDAHLRPHPVEQHTDALAKVPPMALPSLSELGFERTNLLDIPIQPGLTGAAALLSDFLERMDAYADSRDYPARKGPSYLSVHLRFGTVSIRQLAREARARGGRGADTWLSELIWRDFYFQILFHHPHVVERAFKPEYDKVRFDNDPNLVDADRKSTRLNSSH